MTVVLEPVLTTKQARARAGRAARAAIRSRADRIKALHESGLKPDVIAKRLSISERTVHRWLNRFYGDEWKTVGRVSDEQRARILRLSVDQVPPGWIAEDCKVSRRLVDMVREDAELPIDAEWASIRRQIQARPELFELHLQFMPQVLRRA